MFNKIIDILLYDVVYLKLLCMYNTYYVQQFKCNNFHIDKFVLSLRSMSISPLCGCDFDMSKKNNNNNKKI